MFFSVMIKSLKMVKVIKWKALTKEEQKAIKKELKKLQGYAEENNK